MVSWTDCAGKHQHCGALGWGGLIISLWNIHYSTWNYMELTRLRVHWEVHDPLEQTQSHSGMKPFHFAPHSSRALPPTRCSASAFSLLIPVILAWTVICCVFAICSTMGPWYLHGASGWECDTNNNAPRQPGYFGCAAFQIVSFLHTLHWLAILQCDFKLLILTFEPYLTFVLSPQS